MPKEDDTKHAARLGLTAYNSFPSDDSEPRNFPRCKRKSLYFWYKYLDKGRIRDVITLHTPDMR